MEYPSIEEIVTKHSKTTDHVLIRFLIHGKLVVVTKSVTPKHISEKFKVHCGLSVGTGQNLVDQTVTVC
ncbi:hypothetical protein ACRRTK_002545 [Alexandromys fortis]